MKKLENINDCKTISEALELLLSFENSLNFNELADELDKNFPNRPLKKKLGQYLCGMSGEGIVVLFCDGYNMFNQFKRNVAFNSVNSVPYIVKVLQLYLLNTDNCSATESNIC